MITLYLLLIHSFQVIVESGTAQIPILTRVSPRVTPTNLFPSVLQEDSHTPTPPQLLTVETSHLFKPIMPDMNTTFDKEEGKIIFALLMNVLVYVSIDHGIQ